MARLLFITIGLSGGLNSNLEFARRAAQQGHAVSFLGHRDLRERIGYHGFDYVRVVHDEQARSELQERVDNVGVVRALPMALRLRRELVASPEIELAVADIAPDALIIDVEAHYALIATHPLRIPTITKSDFFSFAHQRGIPPLHSTQDMPRNLADRVKAEFEWGKAKGKRMVTKTLGELHPRRIARRWTPFRYNTVMRRDLKAVAKARGLDLNDISSQQGWLWPQTYPDLPLVSTTPQELDFVSKTSPNDQWVGPLIPSARPAAETAAGTNQDWETFKDRNEHSGRPLLYCSFGTMWPNIAAMVEIVIQAVMQRDDWDLVVGLGGRGGQQLTTEHGRNILVLDYAPQLEVLANADLAIIHGGINGILESLAFGVPVIVERGGAGDAPGNASRVKHFGVGRSIGIADQTAASLASLIDQVLNDSAMQARVTTLQSQFLAYQENQVLERFLERFLQSSSE